MQHSEEGHRTRSVFTEAPRDARAETVRGSGDGETDDTASIQTAIDASFARGGGGVVFVPSGRYRLTRTVYVWPGVRVFGTGPTRPVFVLSDGTPGFEDGLATMIIFTGSGRERPLPPAFPPPDSVPFDPGIADANPGTAYSAMSNVAFEIGEGNAGAIGVRFHAAQNCYLSHIHFDMGSGLAGVYQAGNEMEDIHFRGGRYGVLTEKPSPAWQFTLIDSSFEGQRDAAMREHEAGLTLANVSIRDTPIGIEIDRGYGDWLFGKDVRFQDVSRAAVLISNEDNAYTQINFQDVLASRTPTFARFRDSGRTVGGEGETYRVDEFGYGLTVPGLGRVGEFETVMEARAIDTMPAEREPVIRPLPPVSDWVNVRDLGAAGDNATDDTAALRRAIGDHRVLYFPAGFYRVTDTLLLRPDTVLIGLHPSLTQIVLPDGTPGYEGVGPAKALVEAPRDGETVVTGIGLDTGGTNMRAVALLWRAGEASLVDDLMFHGGHGTRRFDGAIDFGYNTTRDGPADPSHRWGGQYPSIWVTDGGGGTFANVWTPDPFAHSGFRISHTSTPGRIYQLSAEHHVRTEVQLDRVENWELYAPQTEEEGWEGLDTVSLDIRNSRNILIANYHGYRVTRTRKPVHSAVRLENVADIRFRNVHVNSESGLGVLTDEGPATFLRLSKFPYSNSIYDVTNGLEVREREFARLDVPARPEAPPATGESAPVRRAGGFWSISGATVDASGKLYFVDNYFQRIYGFCEREGLTIERDDTLDPVNLAIDAAGDLMVLSSFGREASVYSFTPGTPATEMKVLERRPIGAHAGAKLLLPGNWWVNGEFRDQIDPETYEFTTLAEMFARYVAVPKADGYVSPDGSLVLPAHRVFAQGADHRGLRLSDTLDAYSLVAARPGERVYLSNDSEDVTYTGLVGDGGAVSDLRVFANRGGESVVEGPDGNVYIANGEVFVYEPDGRMARRIDVPERPLQLVFGGEEARTLYILAHHALYTVRP